MLGLQPRAIVADLGGYPPAFTYWDLLPMHRFRGFSLAPDGKSFATSMFRTRGDIWLVEVFQESWQRGFSHVPFRKFLP